MLKWTNEPPTEEGWYWTQYEGSVEVAKLYLKHGEWCCQYAGNNGAYMLKDDANAWAGPIPEPVETEEMYDGMDI